MAAHPVTDAQKRQALEALALHGTESAAARSLDLPRNTYRNRLRAAHAAPPPPDLDRGFEPPVLPDELPTAEELLARRRTQFSRKATAKEARALIVRLLAERLGYGAEKHGDPYNYRLGAGDAEYYRDRVNHLREHAWKLDPAGTKEERAKQIAACAANLMMLLWLDDHAVQESEPFIIPEQPKFPNTGGSGELAIPFVVTCQGDGDPGGAPI